MSQPGKLYQLVDDRKRLLRCQDLEAVDMDVEPWARENVAVDAILRTQAIICRRDLTKECARRIKLEAGLRQPRDEKLRLEWE